MKNKWDREREGGEWLAAACTEGKAAKNILCFCSVPFASFILKTFIEILVKTE